MGQANVQSLEESLNMFFIAKLEVVNIHVVTFKYTCNYFIRLNIGSIIAMRKGFFFFYKIPRSVYGVLQSRTTAFGLFSANTSTFRGRVWSRLWISRHQ